jgi:hypothetical protein
MAERNNPQMSETDKDMANVEAWAEVVADMLYLMPPEHRLSTLRLALEKEQAATAERTKNGGFVVRKFSLENLKPALKHWNTKMRLRSLVIQAFVRQITNNNSPEHASELLFSHHRYGMGSGDLDDYIDDLPR